MSLSFTDAQLQSISSDYVSADASVKSYQNTLISAQAAVTTAKQKDTDNITFQNHMLNIVHQFHWELANINGSLHTDYNTANIDPAARALPGNLHFQPGWTFLYARVDQSNNGLPFSSQDNEFFHAPLLLQKLGYLKNGYGSGSLSVPMSSALSGNSFQVADSTGITVGMTLVLYDAQDFAIGTVSAVSITGGGSGGLGGTGGDAVPATITMSFSLSPQIGIGSSGFAVSNYPGFSNSQRQSNPSTAIFTGLRSSIDRTSTNLIGRLQAQLDALNANDSGDASNATAKSQVTSIIKTVKAWQTGPSSGVNGRYADAALNPFLQSLNTRESQAQQRAPKILGLLGNVTNSSSDGSLSGSGYYLQMMQQIDNRVNIMNGTLRKYYNSQLGVTAVQSQISSAQQKKAQYASALNIQLFTKDADGTKKVFVQAAVGFVGGSTVKVIADGQSVLTVKIVAISLGDNSISFDTIIPAAYSMGSNARVVVQK